MSCWAYRDTWSGFFQLFRKFWPTCPYPITLVTDRMDDGAAPCSSVFVSPGTPWTTMLAHFLTTCTEPVMLFLDDYFLSAPVNTVLVRRGLRQMERMNAGCVRLYPCPGANADYGDADFGMVTPGTPYRISSQVSIWKPQYLRAIASQCRDHGEASDLEIGGTQFAESLPDPVLAFKRDSGPWPIQYLCSAVSRARWNPDAQRLCEAHGIDADWTMREFA